MTENQPIAKLLRKDLSNTGGTAVRNTVLYPYNVFDAIQLRQMRFKRVRSIVVYNALECTFKPVEGICSQSTNREGIF